MDPELKAYLSKILSNQATIIEILCAMSANGNLEKQNELLKIALEQSQLHFKEMM